MRYRLRGRTEGKTRQEATKPGEQGREPRNWRKKEELKKGANKAVGGGEGAPWLSKKKPLRGGGSSKKGKGSDKKGGGRKRGKKM